MPTLTGLTRENDIRITNKMEQCCTEQSLRKKSPILRALFQGTYWHQGAIVHIKRWSFKNVSQTCQRVGKNTDRQIWLTVDFPPNYIAKTLSGFSICFFKNSTHDPEAPPHYHITVPITDESYLLLCVMTSQVENIAWYYHKKQWRSWIMFGPCQ